MKRFKGLICVFLIASVLASVSACRDRHEAEETTEETTEETIESVTESSSVNGASFETVATTTTAEVADTSVESSTAAVTTNMSDYIIADDEDRTWDLYVDTEEEQAQARQDVEDGNLSGYVVYDGAGNRITNDDGTYESHEVNATANEDTPYADYENPPDIEEEE